jgi:nucleoside-diphosphate-sugar epimerase
MIKDVKVMIFGANGGIGRVLVKQALDNGYNVRATFLLFIAATNSLIDSSIL